MPSKRSKQGVVESEIERIEVARPTKPLPIIKVVGISGGGKSTLVSALRAHGYDARPVSQEHSNVPNLWQQFDRPDYLIFLNTSLEDQQARRQDVSWTAAAHQEELRRLAHAREHADLRVDTGDLTASDVYKVARSYLIQQRVRHADHPLDALPITGSSHKTPSSPDES